MIDRFEASDPYHPCLYDSSVYSTRIYNFQGYRELTDEDFSLRFVETIKDINKSKILEKIFLVTGIASGFGFAFKKNRSLGILAVLSTTVSTHFANRVDELSKEKDSMQPDYDRRFPLNVLG